MKAYKMEVYVVDFEDYGPDSYVTELEQMDVGNALIQVRECQTAEIGEFDDDHPFNSHETPIGKLRKYFKK